MERHPQYYKDIALSAMKGKWNKAVLLAFVFFFNLALVFIVPMLYLAFMIFHLVTGKTVSYLF
jgi:hypothetical protein